MKNTSLIALFAFLLLRPASALEAQPSRLDALPAATRSVVAPIIDSARAAGLPTGRLESRVLEGSRKGATPTLIAEAVRRLAASTGEAQRALGTGARPEDVELGAEVITRGVAASVLTELRPRTPGRSVSAALTLLDDMVARGLAPDQAGSTVVSLTRGGVGDEQLAAIKLNFERQVAVGTPPATAASTAVAAERVTRGDALGVTDPRPATTTPTRPVREKP